jgi:tetratricopeptide repeat protein
VTPGSDRRALGVALRVVAAVLVWSTVASAQPSEQAAAATAQFDLGRALMKQKNYTEACAAFERSQKLDPQWGTLYNLATCYAMSDRLASAWAAYRELAQRDTNPARRKESARQARELERRLPRLTLTVADAPPGLAVTLDGADVTALIGSESPVDLGRHVIRATAPGYADFERAKTVVDEGKRVQVAIELRRAGRPRPEPVSEPPTEPRPAPGAADTAARGADTSGVAARAAPEPSPAHREPAVAPAAQPSSGPADGAPSPPPERSSRSTRRTYGIVAGAAGGALVATGLVFGKLASSKWNDAKALCGADLTCDSSGDLATGNQLVSDARLRANLSTALVIGGAAAIGLGAVLVVTAPRGNAPGAPAAVRLLPSATPSAVSLTLEGRF